MVQVLPLLWRTLLQSYLRTLALSIATFLAVLVITRFKEIARFTALSGNWGKTLLFISYQFPLILPMAIPISALIAALLLFQKLSRTGELTALRAASLGLRSILAPLLLSAALLSIGTFSICSELAPFCRKESKAMLIQETSANPLFLLQRQHLGKLKHAYLDMAVQDEGKSANHVTVISYNDRQKRLLLLQAETLTMKEDELIGEHASILSHPSGRDKGFDPLVIENASSISMSAPILSKFLKKSSPKFQAHAKPLSLLLAERGLQGKKKALSAYVEIFRRASLSLAVFTFTFLGASFGISIRRSQKTNWLSPLLLSLTVLASYLLGKDLKLDVPFLLFFFLFPHLLISFLCLCKLKRVSRGVSL